MTISPDTFLVCIALGLVLVSMACAFWKMAAVVVAALALLLLITGCADRAAPLDCPRACGHRLD